MLKYDQMRTKLYAIDKQFRWLKWPPVFTFSLVFILFLLLSYGNLDPDFGWHLASGDYFVNHGIPNKDIFSYTASDFHWINHEWLSDILIYYIYSLGGYIALAFLYAGLWTLAFYLVGRKIYGPIVLLAVLAVLPFAGIRAVTWTVIFSALIYFIIFAKDIRYRIILPIVFLAWVNIHGSFLIGLLLLGYWAVTKQSKSLAIILVVSFALSFLNPYGYNIYTEIFRTMTDSSLRWTISEWLPVGDVWQTIGYVGVWAAGFLVLIANKWRSYLQIDFLLFMAAQSSIRHYPIFVILSLPYSYLYSNELIKRMPKKLKFNQLIVSYLLIRLITTISIWGLYSMNIFNLDRESKYPSEIVSYLKNKPCNGNIFNEYNIGGYLIWKLPEQKVYIDGRMPSWELNGRKYMSDYLRFFDDKDFRNQQIQEYNIGCIIIKSKNNETMIDDLKNNGWNNPINYRSYIIIEK